MSPRPADEDDDEHYRQVVGAFHDGRVVPLLGAGVNRCGGPQRSPWDGKSVPDGVQLAHHLASFSYFPDPHASDLVRVSQYVSVMLGDGPLYEELHKIFVPEYNPTPVHRFLAEVPALLERRGAAAANRPQLILTTNYDDVLERAFQAARAPYEVIAYVADGKHAGKFQHYPPGDADPILIEVANDYRALQLDERTLIVKIHGAVDRRDPDHDSYVITEDDYIEYLTRTELANLPATVAARLRRCHFLFLGYSLRDWNLRVILHRIWGEQPRNYESWAVQRHPEKLDRRFWDRRGVEIRDIDLTEYIGRLSDLMRA